MHLIMDRNDLPFAVIVTAANIHDSKVALRLKGR